MLELPQKHKILVKTLLKRYVPNNTVWAYGSRVNGTASEGSDLDLVVLEAANAALSPVQLKQLRTAFSESALPIKVDIADWTRIPAHFQHEIQRRHECIKRVS